MTKKEKLVNLFLDELEVEAECDNIDTIYELCRMLIMEAKVKTLDGLKDYFLCLEEEDE